MIAGLNSQDQYLWSIMKYMGLKSNFNSKINLKCKCQQRNLWFSKWIIESWLSDQFQSNIDEVIHHNLQQELSMHIKNITPIPSRNVTKFDEKIDIKHAKKNGKNRKKKSMNNVSSLRWLTFSPFKRKT